MVKRALRARLKVHQRWDIFFDVVGVISQFKLIQPKSMIWTRLFWLSYGVSCRIMGPHSIRVLFGRWAQNRKKIASIYCWLGSYGMKKKHGLRQGLLFSVYKKRFNKLRRLSFLGLILIENTSSKRNLSLSYESVAQYKLQLRDSISFFDKMSF